MNIFKRILKREGQEQRAFIPTVSGTPSMGTISFRGSDNPTVSSCINKIANTLSILPLELYAHTKSGKKLAVGNSLFRVLERPNFEESASIFYNTMVKQLLYKGNVYLWIGRAQGKIVSMQLIDPNKIRVIRNENGRKGFVIGDKTYTEKEVLHIPYPNGYNGTVGVSPITTHSELIELDNQLLSYINAYFNNSLGTRYAVELGASYGTKPQDLDKMYASLVPLLNKFVNGVQNSGKPLIPPPDSKLSKIEQTSNVQSDLASLLTMVERQIAEAFGIPYEVINSEGQKYASLEQKQQDFLQSCIQPLGNHISECFMQLLPVGDTALFVAYDYTHMLKSDIKTTVDYLAKEVQSGLLTVNEARSKLQMQSVGEEGDVLFMPANLVPLTKENIDAFLAKSKLALTQMGEGQEHNPMGDDKS